MNSLIEVLIFIEIHAKEIILYKYEEKGISGIVLSDKRACFRFSFLTKKRRKKELRKIFYEKIHFVP